jgi:hypothetical protein
MSLNTEQVQREYDDMREQGVDHTAALDHLRLKHGVKRRTLATVLAQRDTIFSTAASPTP